MNKTNMAAPSMGFTPEDMKSISSVLGYTGDSSGFADYLSQNPQAHDSFMGIQKQRLQFDNGGFVATQHMANGGLSQRQEDYIKQNTADGNFQGPGFFAVMVNAPDGSGRQVSAREAYYMQNPDFRPEVLRPFLAARGILGEEFPDIETSKENRNLPFGNMPERFREEPRASDDPVLDQFVNGIYGGGSPFQIGQDSTTLSDGRTITREQYNSLQQRSPAQMSAARRPRYFNEPSSGQYQTAVMKNPDGSAMNEEDMARYDARMAARGQSNIVTPIGQQGPSPLPTQAAPTSRAEQNLANVQAPRIGAETAFRLQDPAIPAAAIYSATQTPTEAAQIVNPATAQLTGDVTIGQAGQAQVSQGVGPSAMTAAAVTAAQAAPDVRDLAAQTVASQSAAPTQAITAVQQGDTSVGQLQAAQTAGAQVQAPTPRQLQAGETIASPTGQAAQAATFVQPTAAVGTPSSQATVQGQLASLISEFTATEVPLWARGAVDNARAVLMQRGIGASSMAGQAIVEAAMRAALPIAQVDAATVAGFEQANLSNRQQAAMVSAQYRAQFMQQEFDQGFQTRVQNAARISDIANLNFSSAQQIALENAKLAQTTDLSNLSNKQALVIANAAQVAGLETANLNNRQQSAVQNAQNFLQVDMANLGNEQQTALFNSQNRTQSILSDVASENAARQFNAANKQQLDQFFANLGSQVSQQNSAQANAINQFNAGEINTLQRFNSEIVNQRDQFNAQNQVAIAQSNAQWRRNLATTDTAAVNFQNQLNAQNLLDISNTAYSNLWQEYRDVMEWSWSSGENESERLAAMTVAQLNAKSRTDLAEYNANRENTKAVGGFVGDIFSGVLKAGASSVFKSIPLIGGLF